MQTFVPDSTSYAASVKVLDRARLGKQRVECLQILHALDPLWPKDGWKNHPAVKMWRGYEGALAQYALACVEEWMGRGYNDIKCGPQLRVYAAIYPDETKPSWWGDERVHQSHRSRLMQKAPDHYCNLWPHEPRDLEYFWPI